MWPIWRLQLVLQVGTWSGGGVVEERAGTQPWKLSYNLFKMFGVFHKEKRVEGVF